ncbi:MAG: UDP-N-acetylmuramoyl-L-alanine--D-glutamate ligase [Balneolaceae bacterium]
MRDLNNKHIVVIGAARSGLAVASLLKQKGAKVFVSDISTISDAVKQQLETEHIPYEENGHTEKARSAEIAVLSPGVPSTIPLVRHYLDKGKQVVSELEVASWFNRSRTIAVTGSNGKTTVTSWLSHTWKKAQKPSLSAGNIGSALSGQVSRTGPDSTVMLEVSSFQLDHIDRFRPDIGIILNITPDHLDRYNNDFELYKQSKFRLTENQSADDIFIYNQEDPSLAARANELQKKKHHPQLLAFSDSREVDAGAFVRDQQIVFKFNNKEEPFMHIDEIGLAGRHNLNNGLATALAARASEIKSDAIRESLKTFEGVEHRLEQVRVHEGVRYVNDSKATNINAVWYALDSFNMPIVLILGGRDKGNDYTELEGLLREKVHTVIAIGEARPAIKKQIGKTVLNYLEAETMKEAVRLSYKQAKRGEIVLLSPACSSFDMFDNYEHRGEVFKQSVLEL